MTGGPAGLPCAGQWNAAASPSLGRSHAEAMPAGLEELPEVKKLGFQNQEPSSKPSGSIGTGVFPRQAAVPSEMAAAELMLLRPALPL